MIQNVPGGAMFETPAGSAASRSSDSQQRQAAQAAGAADKTSSAHDATTQAQTEKPVAQTGGGERSTDDSTRGRTVDIRA